MKTPLCAALCLCVAAICPAQESNPHAATAKPVVTSIINAQGQTIGTATLSPATKGVKIVFDIKNLPPGDHPVHFHQSGRCEPPDFKTAGSHFEGGHDHTMPAGDIPNFTLTVNDDHKAHVTTIAPFVTLSDDTNSVFSGGGTAIIIHATSNEVNGGAPPRIACGVITRPN